MGLERPGRSRGKALCAKEGDHKCPGCDRGAAWRLSGWTTESDRKPGHVLPLFAACFSTSGDGAEAGHCSGESLKALGLRPGAGLKCL